jgi:hypothetical protein
MKSDKAAYTRHEMEPRRWRSRRAGWIAVFAYGVVLGTSPLLHHDFACHLKTPSHCDACVSSPLAQAVETGIRIAPPRPLDTGRPAVPANDRGRQAFRMPCRGRAPPA